MKRADLVTEPAAKHRLGHDAEADLVAHDDRGGGTRSELLERGVPRRADLDAVVEAPGDPEGQRVDEQHVARVGLRDHAGEVGLRFERAPSRGPHAAVAGDARVELWIAWPRRGNVGHAIATDRGGAGEGEAGLPAAGPTKHEGKLAHRGSAHSAASSQARTSSPIAP